jgi:hypothetical protein
VSRGPGRVERAIRALLDANPDDAFTTSDLAERCYPNAAPVEHKHRVAVRGAAQKVIDRDRDWHIMGRYENVCFNYASLRSLAMGRALRNSDYRLPYWITDRAERIRAMDASDWYREQMSPDGAWARRVALHIACRDGDHALAERLHGQLVTSKTRHDESYAVPRSRCCALLTIVNRNTYCTEQRLTEARAAADGPI